MKKLLLLITFLITSNVCSEIIIELKDGTLISQEDIISIYDNELDNQEDLEILQEDDSLEARAGQESGG